MNDTITLLRARRSAPPAAMSGPDPTPQEIEILLAPAARMPDHGKLAPWRFILFEGAGRERAGEIFAEIYAKANPGGDNRRVEAERNRFASRHWSSASSRVLPRSKKSCRPGRYA